MSYLHSNNFIHRNLDTENIFLDENLYPKISNFKNSIELPKNGFIEEYSIKGKIQYQSPEVLTNLIYSKSSDVYAFSLIMYSILTNNEPFQNLKGLMDAVWEEDYRPSLEGPISECYKKLIQRCWSKDPNERPTFSEILNELKNNPEFVTETVDREEFESYIKFIEDSPKSFDQNSKKRKLDEVLSITNKPFYNRINDDSCESPIKREIEFEMDELRNFYEFDSNNEYKSYNAFQYYDYDDDRTKFDRINVEIYRKEINFFFKHEIYNLYQKLNVLSQINHPRILKFYGFSPFDFENQKRPTIFYETYDHNISINPLFNRTKPNYNLPMIYDIASAMSYLHSHNIIHRNLTTASIFNTLFDGTKIGGFDIAIDLSNYHQEEEEDKIKGVPAYLAPEIYTNKEYSKASDVYSFAMVLYEIITSKKPFDDCLNPNEIKEKVVNLKQRPKFHMPINQNYRKLIERCWSQDPKERPTFDEILQELRTNPAFIDRHCIEILDNTTSTFQPEKRITYFDKIIANQLHTFQEIGPCACLNSMYETETNDLSFKYDYFHLMKFKKSESIKHFFYNIEKIENEETNELYMNKFTYYINDFTKDDIINFSSEMKIISQLNHPSILKFIGFNIQQDRINELKYNVIVEYSPKEPLNKIIEKNYSYLNDTKKLITIYGIASAMSFLHSHGILHRDLKTANIYYDEFDHPKLSGFNISIETGHNLKEKCDKIKGTPSYLAPEVYLKNEYSYASDVYSFSLVMYEIITSKKPFDKKHSPKQIKEKLIKMERPLFDEQTNESYRKLIERCWSQNPKERPTFDEIVNELKNNRDFLLDSVDEEEYKNYISFINESSKTFDASKRITRFDLMIKNNIKDFYELNNKINIRNIYETEYDEVLIDYDFIDINNYEFQNSICLYSSYHFFDAVDKRTGKKCQAGQYNFNFAKLNSLFSKNNACHEVNKLIGLNHPSIINFIGFSPYISENEDRPVFIIEYTLPHVNLYTFIKENDFNEVYDTKRLIILYGIASGMSYLHSKNIIIRDFELGSISCDECLFPKISNLSNTIKDYGEPIIIPLKGGEDNFYAPPERLKDNLICPAGNVYSFGMIAYTLLEKSEPFNDCKDYFEILLKIEKDDIRPEFKEEDPKCFTQLIEKCWAADPSQRPTFNEITYYLKTNPEFITEKVDKNEFFDYVNFIDKCESSNTYIQIDDYIKSNNCAFRKVKYDYEDFIDRNKIKFSIDMGSIEISDYKIQKKIGEGNFGEVYNVIERKTNKNYAAKISRTSIDDITDAVDIYNDSIINLIREIEIISQLNHHSILQFIGYSPVSFDKSMKNPVIITELVTNGSLGRLINSERMGLAPHDWDDTKKLINIYGIAAGMKYIHELNILHRDLKPDNIHLDEFLYPRICDFGLSKLIEISNDFLYEFENESILKNKSLLKGSPAYISPEIFQNNQYSKAGDVYAFGLIVYEIITNNNIFDEALLNIYQIGLKVINGYRPNFNFQIPYVYKKLITKCWDENPNKRPSFDKICESLEKDKRFITENVDENEFLDFVSFTQEKLKNTTIKQTKTKKVTFEVKTNNNEEEEKIDKLEDFFLELSNFEVQSTITKRNDSKLLKLKKKQTNFYYQGQFSLIKVDSIFSSENLNILSKEIKIISQLKHPSLLKFIGYSPIDFEKQKKPVIVTELPLNGSLAKLLEISRMKNDEIEGWNPTKKLINIYGIASCLSYLHSHGILHRSLNPSNIFLDEILTPKIGDYGLSTLFSNSNKQMHHQSMIRMKNNSIYSAPEVLIKNEFTTKSDVYSFGMIIYEILSNEIPFNEISNENQLINLVVQNEKRPNINEKVPNKYKELIVKCWSQNPDERPSFDQIVHQLKFDNDFITDNINVDDFNKFVNFIEMQLNSEYSQKIIENEAVLINEQDINDNNNSNLNNSFSEEEEKIEIKEDENFDAKDDNLNKIKEDSYFEQDNTIKEIKEDENYDAKDDNLNKIKEDSYFEQEFKFLPIKNLKPEQDQNNDNESVDQQILLAKRYIEENDTENIYKYFCILVKKGSYMVPLSYSISLYKKKFYKQAFSYFTILSTVNHPISLFYIGVMKFRGEGCLRDEEEAYRILKHLSVNGIERATNFLSDYFEK